MSMLCPLSKTAVVSVLGPLTKLLGLGQVYSRRHEFPCGACLKHNEKVVGYFQTDLLLLLQ